MLAIRLPATQSQKGADSSRFHMKAFGCRSSATPESTWACSLAEQRSIVQGSAHVPARKFPSCRMLPPRAMSPGARASRASLSSNRPPADRFFRPRATKAAPGKSVWARSSSHGKGLEERAFPPGLGHLSGSSGDAPGTGPGSWQLPCGGPGRRPGSPRRRWRSPPRRRG